MATGSAVSQTLNYLYETSADYIAEYMRKKQSYIIGSNLVQGGTVTTTSQGYRDTEFMPTSVTAVGVKPAEYGDPTKVKRTAVANTMEEHRSKWDYRYNRNAITQAQVKAHGGQSDLLMKMVAVVAEPVLKSLDSAVLVEMPMGSNADLSFREAPANAPANGDFINDNLDQATADTKFGDERVRPWLKTPFYQKSSVATPSTFSNSRLVTCPAIPANVKYTDGVTLTNDAAALDLNAAKLVLANNRINNTYHNFTGTKVLFTNYTQGTHWRFQGRENLDRDIAGNLGELKNQMSYSGTEIFMYTNFIIVASKSIKLPKFSIPKRDIFDADGTTLTAPSTAVEVEASFLTFADNLCYVLNEEGMNDAFSLNRILVQEDVEFELRADSWFGIRIKNYNGVCPILHKVTDATLV